MSETLSVQLENNISDRLDALAAHTGRSKSVLAAEAITAFVDAHEWQLGEIQAGISDLDHGRVVAHDRVSKWLRDWGKGGKRRL